MLLSQALQYFYLSPLVQAFLATVRRWGHKQPPLYDIHKLLKTLEGGLAVTRKDPWLLQAQAELCIISKQYQKALLCYLEMDNSQQVCCACMLLFVTTHS